MDRTQPIPRSEAEVMATAKRLRGQAAMIRGLLADPGGGCDDFKQFGPQVAERKEQLAAVLETVAHD